MAGLYTRPSLETIGPFTYPPGASRRPSISKVDNNYQRSTRSRGREELIAIAIKNSLQPSKAGALWREFQAGSGPAELPLGEPSTELSHWENHVAVVSSYLMLLTVKAAREGKLDTFEHKTEPL